MFWHVPRQPHPNPLRQSLSAVHGPPSACAAGADEDGVTLDVGDALGEEDGTGAGELDGNAELEGVGVAVVVEVEVAEEVGVAVAVVEEVGLGVGGGVARGFRHIFVYTGSQPQSSPGFVGIVSVAR